MTMTDEERKKIYKVFVVGIWNFFNKYLKQMDKIHDADTFWPEIMTDAEAFVKEVEKLHPDNPDVVELASLVVCEIENWFNWRANPATFQKYMKNKYEAFKDVTGTDEAKDNPFVKGSKTPQN